MADTAQSTISATAPAGASSKKSQKPRLGDHNSALYNCSSFAVTVSADELFCDENLPHFKKLITAASMKTPNALWVPYEVVKLTTIKQNPIFPQPYGSKFHMDKFFPMVLCVSHGQPIAKIYLDKIYDDEGVYDQMIAHTESIEKHTGEKFVDRMTDDSEALEKMLETAVSDDTGEKLVGDEDVVLIFLSIFHAIHMLGNKDTVLRYSSVTDCQNKVTLGGDGVCKTQAKMLFSSERNSPLVKKGTQSTLSTPVWQYSPSDADCKRGVAYRLGCSRLVMSEYRHMLRILLKFGKGDTKTKTNEREIEDDFRFEADLLSVIAAGTHPTGAGALGYLGSYMEYICLVSTVVPTEKKREIPADPEVVWNMFVANYMSEFAASNICQLSVADTGRVPALNYHVKSSNPLTNIMLTASKESSTFCGLIMYLVEKLYRSRCNPNTVANICTRSNECVICTSGNHCSLNWTVAFTNNSTLALSLTDGKKTSLTGPSGKTFNIAVVTEYNEKATIMGAMNKRGENSAHGPSASAPFIKAFTETIKAFDMAFEKEIESTKSKAGSGRVSIKSVFGCLESTLGKVKQYIYDAKHMQTIPNRRVFDTKKLECILSDNEGGVPKINMGMMCFPMAKSKVLLFISRFANQYNLNLDGFANNTAEAKQYCLTALAKTLGATCERAPQEKYKLKTIAIRPLTDNVTQEEINISSGSRDEKQYDVASLWAKSINKFKMLCGTVKNSDGVNKTRVSWSGMDIGNASFGSSNGNLSKTQGDAIRSSINWIIKSTSAGYDPKKWVNTVNRLIDNQLGESLGQFCSTELKCMRSVTDLMELHVIGTLMTANDYWVQPNSFFDGCTIPRFGEIVKSDKITTAAMNDNFLNSGPAILFSRVEVGSFVATVEGCETKYVFCALKEQPNLSMFLPSHKQGMMNTSLRGVFIPVKNVFNGGDPNDKGIDSLVEQFKTMFEMSPKEQICYFASNAGVFAQKVREWNHMSDAEPVSVDQVFELFTNYGVRSLLDDQYMLEIAQNLENDLRLGEIAERAKETMIDDDEEEGEDDYVEGWANDVSGVNGRKRRFDDVGGDDCDGSEAKKLDMMLKEFEDC